MPRPFALLTLFLALSILTLCSSCRSRKGVEVSDGMEKVKEPFSSAEYRSDENYVRYVGIAKDPNLASVKQVALIEAQSGIALLANKQIEGMFTNYLNYTNAANRNESAKHIQALFDGMIQLRLPFTRIIGEEVYKDKKTGEHLAYVAVAISVEDLEKESLRLLQEDARLKNLVSEEGYRALMEKKLQQNKTGQTATQSR